MDRLDISIIRRLEKIGEANFRLVKLLRDDVFESLSKHNPWFDSQHEEEANKLEDLRLKISFFERELWEIVELFDNYNED